MLKKIIAFLILQFSICFAQAGGRVPPLLPEATLKVMAEEISGVKAKRTLEFLAQHHRMRGSRGYLAAAEYIAAQLRQYGLSEVAIEQIPADGKTFYGPQKARLAWDAEFAELWEVHKSENGWKDSRRLASREAMPIALAQDSESADVIAQLVDIGTGTDESDYTGKDVRGKIVLVSSQPGPVSEIAVEKYGAAGIVSYAQNQHTAWWGENENLVRWGHLESFSSPPTFAFMVSLKQARSFQSGKEALQAVFAEFSSGSDHVIYTDGSYGIPAIYLNDWPDRYIHTNFDTPANINPTKLKRAAFIGAASGYFLAGMATDNIPALWSIFQPQCLRRTAAMLERWEELSSDEAANLAEFHFRYEREVFNSIIRFSPIPDSILNEAETFWANLETLVGKPSRAEKYRRGDDWFWQYILPVIVSTFSRPSK
jgi:hypothetical protein